MCGYDSELLTQALISLQSTCTAMTGHYDYAIKLCGNQDTNCVRKSSGHLHRKPFNLLIGGFPNLDRMKMDILAGAK